MPKRMEHSPEVAFVIMMKSAEEWIEELGLPAEIKIQSRTRYSKDLIQKIQNDVKIYIKPL